MRTSLRTHTCGELRSSHVNQEVTLCGWVHALRNQGGVVFVDLRDRYGRTQVTFRGDRDAALLEHAERVRGEWVLRVEGVVIARPKDAQTDRIPTGEVELDAKSLYVFSRAKTPPFPLDGRSEAGAETRLRSRFLDLRRRVVTDALTARAKIVSTIRRHMESLGFVDIETPTMIRSTPEGARDYLVPSRLQPGRFYALPQSPQLFKQLLMVGGQDRYYQIARCYRDEDLRADRQPEFTQLDMEASFVSEEDVFDILDPLVAQLVETWRGQSLPLPLPRMTYADAMARFGTDKPDLRNPLELQNLAGHVDALAFPIFTRAVGDGGIVKAIRAPGGGSLSRKQFNELESQAKSMGAPGLAWAKVTEERATGPLGKVLTTEAGGAVLRELGAVPGDAVFVSAGRSTLVHRVLGGLRDGIADLLSLRDHTSNALVWITEFPLFLWSDERECLEPAHHPFTSIHDEDVPALFEAATIGSQACSDPAQREALEGMRSRAYDLVMNGHELGSGSVRIHDEAMQEAVFALLGMDGEEIERRFGWFVRALKYGTPPHGGMAWGLDRLVMCLLGETAIQNVIAFPKTLAATDLMCRAPADVDAEQLEELGLAVVAPPESAAPEAAAPPHHPEPRDA